MKNKKIVKTKRITPTDEVLRRLKDIDTLIDGFKERLVKVEEMKEKQMEFIFQSVSITIGIFAVVLTLVIGLSTKWDFEQYGEGLAILLLSFIFGLLLIWYVKWSRYIKK